MFLLADKVKTFTVAGKTYKINQRIMPEDYPAPKDVASYVKRGEAMKPCALLHGDGIPCGITVHNTNMIKPAVGTNAAEQYCRATYNGNMSGVIVHYYIWHDIIWQLLDDTERGWHATDGSTRRNDKTGQGIIGGNLDTIAIEAIGPDKETEETTAALCAKLCIKYALLPMEDVYPHRFFYPAKYCPEYILPHWDVFLKRVKELYLTTVTAEVNLPVPEKEDNPDEWAAESWKWAKSMKLITSSNPHDVVTMQQLAVILDRFDR